jgi:hypothetical protein
MIASRESAIDLSDNMCSLYLSNLWAPLAWSVLGLLLLERREERMREAELAGCVFALLMLATLS